MNSVRDRRQILPKILEKPARSFAHPLSDLPQRSTICYSFYIYDIINDHLICIKDIHS